MINLKKATETCQNHNLRISESPSERVSVDVNTLLSQSNEIPLRTTYPTEPPTLIPVLRI